MDSPGQTITFNIPPHGDFEHSFTYVITVNNTQLIDLSDDWIKIWNKLTKTNNDQYKHRKLEINSQCPITLDDIKNGEHGTMLLDGVYCSSTGFRQDGLAELDELNKARGDDPENILNFKTATFENNIYSS